MVKVTVCRLEGRRLLGTAGRHQIVTDRKTEDGGTDTGCTSGELLLLAAGSCATGSLRKFLEGRGIACPDLAVAVSFVPSPAGGDREAIAVEVSLPDGIDDSLLPEIVEAAQGGGVVSRLRLGSEILVRCTTSQPV